MTRLLRAGHRELHLREEAALAPFEDVPFRAQVRLGARDADRVEPELRAESFDLCGRHAKIMPGEGDSDP
jgi:hypothetical protein